MGITNDVTRGVVGVAGVSLASLCCPLGRGRNASGTVCSHLSTLLLQGMPYSLLLPRSLDFATPFIGLKVRYENPADRILLLNGMQLLWNRIDPVGEP
jgi:hypothetical protein